ncbi:hypothetical protein [Gordonia sp. 852002-51296_SCH5728562-b]|uniref:hypothetical protein n=1 Tax=Gordonia sp. 852002-51296_SCH5728562-b TaxID=1834101 RepID=UPI0007EB1F9B|nr:hypothetical protein [Gordonia sp. 852002-51296_SCH5728562-b]OBA38989.1 hypothetical protein A5766_04340 [Gordonia sp. 852002-51296_SCH5728562-b]
MSNITIEDATEIIESVEIPDLSAQAAIDKGLVVAPSVEARYDSQTDWVEVAVNGEGWNVDSAFIEVCDGLVDSDDMTVAIEEVLASLQDADSPRVPLEDLTALVTADSPHAGFAPLTTMAQSMRDDAIAAQSMAFYANHGSVDVVVERSHGCRQCGEWHHLSGPIHTGSMVAWSQQQGCGAIMGPSSRTVELDIEGGTVSAEDVDEASNALTEAASEVLAEDLDWIERDAPRWAAQIDNADWEDALAYDGTIFQDEAIVDGVREAGYQAVVDVLVTYGVCVSEDEARERVLSALTEAVIRAA